jgi:hypothetical protein
MLSFSSGIEVTCLDRFVGLIGSTVFVVSLGLAVPLFHGVGHICEVYDDRMAASDYIHILKTELADTLDYYRLRDGDFIFQHDNDPKHTAEITIIYLK